ncbi:hypothetical protein AMS68_005838 [Peltaster fructicola]|uniref:Neutral ceramidase n=1 Tax=Peltaster fructicola TaxID=286661 RepID=A0A6H0Y072_9PEZI|nr:hypothetical protein AMS68_005838 [Peltaster fructicola]
MTHSRTIAVLAAGLLFVLSSLYLVGRLQPSAFRSDESWHSQVDTKTDSFLTTTVNQNNGSQYLLGVGRGDITGPVVEINFMGYADTSQVGSGLRQRLYSRAFIVGNTDEPIDRFVYLVLDTQSGDTAVRHGILEALKALGGEYALYGNQNVAVSGTHSHSGPGAWVNYLLPQITSYGFHKPSYQAIVDGAITSIKRAHESLAPGRLAVGTAVTHDTNANRSPYAYTANPLTERQRYGKDDVDKNMTVLKFTHSIDGFEKDIGILSWFPVHGTSMYGNNTHVTGDNKGVAAYLYERSMADDLFVAGFSQSNVGDTTPNVIGAYCEFGEQAGHLCDYETSLCAGKNQPCHGRGPYYDLHDGGAASTYEIGRRQYLAAKSLEKSASWTPLQGPVKAAHKFVDFSTLKLTLPNGTQVNTCPAALGHSFAAGTSDGPGKFDFKQAQPGEPHDNPLWSVVGNRIHKPNESQIACHGVKPILLDVGESSSPYAWSPNIVDVQLLRVGQLFVIVSSGEATTMSGRRWRAAIAEAAAERLALPTKPITVLGGPANSYTHYITTEEEYSVQRYEGASTLYGPHTLAAHIDQSLQLLADLDSTSRKKPQLVRGPLPPVHTNSSLSFINEPIFDRAGTFKSFGQLLIDVRKEYHYGESVSATFVGANPRNDLHLESTYAQVEKLDQETGQWYTVRDDKDWSLLFEWKRTSTVRGTSEVTITWETKWEQGDWAIKRDQAPLTTAEYLHFEKLDSTASYRLRYNGDRKGLDGKIAPFTGVSGLFFFAE